MLSRDYEAKVDWIDWLISKSMSLVWRSVFDKTVFESTQSGFDLFGFKETNIRPHFNFSTSIVDSIEDLYRPLAYEEVYELRMVPPGVNFSFLKRSTFRPPSLRSRRKQSDVIRRRLACRKTDLSNMSYLHDTRQIPLKDRVDRNLPPILSSNGFRIQTGQQDVQGVKYYHELGKFLFLPVPF